MSSSDKIGPKERALREMREQRYAFQDAGRREGWRSSETLRHWLEAAFLAVRGRTLVPGGAAWRKNEDEFLKAERRWREPEKTKADLARMLGAAALALESAVSASAQISGKISGFGFSVDDTAGYDALLKRAAWLRGQSSAGGALSFVPVTYGGSTNHDEFARPPSYPFDEA